MGKSAGGYGDEIKANGRVGKIWPAGGKVPPGPAETLTLVKSDRLQSRHGGGAGLNLHNRQNRALLRKDVDFGLGRLQAKTQYAVSLKHQPDRRPNLGLMASLPASGASDLPGPAHLSCALKAMTRL